MGRSWWTHTLYPGRAGSLHLTRCLSLTIPKCTGCGKGPVVPSPMPPTGRPYPPKRPRQGRGIRVYLPLRGGC